MRRAVRLVTAITIAIALVGNWFAWMGRPAFDAIHSLSYFTTVVNAAAAALMAVQAVRRRPATPVVRGAVTVSLAVPIGYACLIFTMDAMTGWYPYSLLDPSRGLSQVGIWIGMTTVVFGAFALLLQRTTNRRLGAA
jgi:FtsH-binding integral membrane protein